MTYKEKPLSKSALGVNVDHRINLIHFNVAEIRALFSAKRVSIRNGWIRATRMSAKEFGSKYKSSLINSTTRKSYVEMIVHALPHEFENINNTESKQIQVEVALCVCANTLFLFVHLSRLPIPNFWKRSLPGRN